MSKNDTVPPLAARPAIPLTSFGHWPAGIRSGGFAVGAALHALRHRPRLAITTHVNFAPIGCYLNKAISLPYWVVAHGIDVWNLKRPALQAALRKADLVLSVSNYTKTRLLEEQALPEDKVVLLPNTFDATRFQTGSKPEYLLQRYGLQKEQPVILTVARLDSREKYKGYDKILAALPHLRRQVPGVCYLIAGKGDDAPRINQLVLAAGLAAQVKVIGYVPDHELNDHYNLCDIFAMPSKGEGFGIVFLEALACGKPVLAGNKDGSVDALLNGELGVLVDPDNGEEIAAALSDVLQRKYSHPLLYEPALLRRRVIEAYGLAQYQRQLAAILASHTTWASRVLAPSASRAVAAAGLFL